MPVPALIPINREEGYYTHFIGKFRTRRQFMAFVIASLPKGPLPNDWQRHKRWYAVVHEFDKDGNHSQTRHEYLGTTADGEREVTKRGMKVLAKLMMELGPTRYCNIKIKPFELEIDGRVFGLVDDSDDGITRVTLWPNDLAFFEPWDGNYDT